MKGYITKGIGGFYYVKTPEGIVECKPRGIFRKQKITPVAGDDVTLETENGAAVIAEIAPRKNVFVRPPMANLDVLFLVASTTQPTPSTLVLDKLAAIAVDKGVQPVIVCTKGDLAEAEFLRKAYEKSTLPFIRIDYETGGGLDEVKQWIGGRLCAFCGNSGVGKSTLLNHLLPGAERETSAISQKLGRGRHTTREVTIFEAFGGRIADTPGFASLEANRAGFIPKENLEHAFPEFGPYLGQCQFTGCSHRSEKGCAVRAALAEALRPDDFIIACDAGYRNCAPLGRRPNIIVGDFDTAPCPEQQDDDIIVLPHVKDDTDTEYAAKLVSEKGFDEVLLLGGLGGRRVEHTLANLCTGLGLEQRGVRTTLLDERSRITYVMPGETRRYPKEKYFFFSAFPMEGRAQGVCERGSYYELTDAELTASYPLGVSNEYAAGSDCITISTRSGALVVVETIAD